MYSQQPHSICFWVHVGLQYLIQNKLPLNTQIPTGIKKKGEKVKIPTGQELEVLPGEKAVADFRWSDLGSVQRDQSWHCPQRGETRSREKLQRVKEIRETSLG